ncbi:MAG: hypothetical protein Q7S40_24075 [Opitutaceae bacterium]|nr:hypothetical protein [Opitutaceae bacterium]
MKTHSKPFVDESQLTPIEYPRSIAMILALGFATMLAAQTMPPSSTQPSKPEETITLNPFEVTADASDTYDATNTNSVTGTNLSLSKTPLAACRT